MWLICCQSWQVVLHLTLCSGGKLSKDCVADCICVCDSMALLLRQVLQLLHQLLSCWAILGCPLLANALNACSSSSSSSTAVHHHNMDACTS
jgi:hypothetical protein